MVIAHPDDEAMFFVPTIMNLTQENKLYLLCLSNGNFDGLGEIREQELIKSAEYLGFAEPPSIVDNQDLQDGKENKWPIDVIVDEIHRFFKKHTHLEFKTIITFDKDGVSSHPNHIAVHHGALKTMVTEQFSIERVLCLQTRLIF